MLFVFSLVFRLSKEENLPQNITVRKRPWATQPLFTISGAFGIFIKNHFSTSLPPWRKHPIFIQIYSVLAFRKILYSVIILKVIVLETYIYIVIDHFKGCLLQSTGSKSLELVPKLSIYVFLNFNRLPIDSQGLWVTYLKPPLMQTSPHIAIQSLPILISEFGHGGHYQNLSIWRPERWEPVVWSHLQLYFWIMQWTGTNMLQARARVC